MSTSPREVTVLAAPLLANERIAALVALQQATRKITSTLDLDALLEIVVEELATRFGCAETAIWLRDPERDDMYVAAIRGCSVHMKGFRAPTVRGMVGHTLTTGKTQYAPDVRLDPHYVSCEHAVLSELDIPLKSRGQVIGVINASHPQLDAFPPEQVRLLRELAAHIAIAVDNAQLFRRERQVNERLRFEQEEARRIQQSLLPKAAPLLDGFTLDGCSVPAGAVGGDWFDYIPMPDGRMALVLADVAGKGMPAALVMSSARALLRAFIAERPCPADVLTRLSRVLIEDYESGIYVTMVLAALDPARRRVTIANAGHPRPLLAHDGQVRGLCGDSGLPLGMLETTYSEAVFPMPAGSRLLFYTDGITEASNPAGEEFGERLHELLLRPEICSDCILREVRSFAGPQPTADDATLILVQSR